MVATLTIDDFIMLGRTFPQQTKNNGVTVCAVGYSAELNQLLRIYPLKITDDIPKWSKVKLTLEKPKTDNRKESWKLQKDFCSKDIVGKITIKQGYEMLSKLVKPSVTQLNKEKVSIGILKPEKIKFKLEKNSNSEEDTNYFQQFNLFSSLVSPTPLKLYSPNYIPRLEIFNSDNSPCNSLQLREWGCSEFIRRGGNPENLVSNLKINDNNYEQLLIVGNMKVHRNIWLVISNVHLQKQNLLQSSLFQDVA